MSRILIVDDLFVNRYLLEKLLQGNGHITISAENGAEALDIGEKTLPDLIISDILMPVMDGFSLCREWKKHPKLQKIPFIFYTATYTTEKDEELALSLGADRFMVKPQEPEVFLQVMEEILNEFQTGKLEPKTTSDAADTVFLKEYNEALVRKLEDKMIQAEQAEQRIRVYARQLEQQIEDRKNAEAQVKESEANLKSLIEASYERIWSVSTDYSYIIFNSACQNAFYHEYGVTLEKGLNSLFLLSTEQREFWRSKYDQALKGERVAFEVSEVVKGELKNFEIFMNPIYSDNVVSGVSVISIDNTERKQVLEALIDSENKYRSIFANTGTASVIIEDSGIISLSNDKFSELCGFVREDIENRKQWLDFVHPGDFAFVAEQFTLWKSQDPLALKNFEFRFVHKDKSVSDIYITIDQIPGTKRYVAALLDITRKNAYESEMKQAKEKAEEMNRLKSNLLSNMSHELRTPMIGILGYTELLKEEKSQNEVRAWADKINKCGTRLMQTLNLILDLSRIEAEKLDLSFTAVDLEKIIDELFESFFENASAKNLSLVKQAKTPIPKVQSNESMVREILNNLINNALKFTDHGGVTVNLDVVPEKEKEYIKIDVIDTGIGIAPADQNLIWEEFRQVSEGRGRGFEGSGLGLTITKKFVEKLNGHVSVTSELGKGSCFSVFIPVQSKINNNPPDGREGTIAAAQTIVSPDSNYIKPALLVVEDDDVTIDFLRFVLSEHYTVSTAENGPDALKLIAETEFKAIIMDINLGRGMNGLEVVAELRKFQNYQNVPVIAVTAFAMEGDKDEFIGAGCDYYLSKPFLKNDLLAVVEDAIRTGRPKE